MDNIESLINKMIKEEIQKTVLSEKAQVVKGVRGFWNWLSGSFKGRRLAGNTGAQKEMTEELVTAFRTIDDIGGVDQASRTVVNSLNGLSKVMSSQKAGAVQQVLRVENLIGPMQGVKDAAASLDKLMDFYVNGAQAGGPWAKFITTALDPSDIKKVKDIAKHFGNPNVGNGSLEMVQANLKMQKEMLRLMDQVSLAVENVPETLQYYKGMMKMYRAVDKGITGVDRIPPNLANTDAIRKAIGPNLHQTMGAGFKHADDALEQMKVAKVKLFGDAAGGLNPQDMLKAERIMVDSLFKTSAQRGNAFIDAMERARLMPVTRTKLLLFGAGAGYMGAEFSGLNDWVAQTVGGIDNVEAPRERKRANKEPAAVPPRAEGPAPVIEPVSIRERTLQFKQVDTSRLPEGQKALWQAGALKPGRGSKGSVKGGCPYLNAAGAQKIRSSATILYQGLMNMGVIKEPAASDSICGEGLEDAIKKAQEAAIKGELRLQKEILKEKGGVPKVIRDLFYKKTFKEGILNLNFDKNKGFELLSEDADAERKKRYAKMAKQKKEKELTAVDGIIGSRTGALIAMYGTKEGFQILQKAARPSGGPSDPVTPEPRGSTGSSKKTSMPSKPPKNYWDLLREMTKMNLNGSLLEMDGCDLGKKPRIHFKFNMISTADGAMREGLEDFAGMKKQAEAQLAEILKEEKFQFSIMQSVKDKDNGKLVKKLVKKSLTDSFAKQLADFAKKVEVSKARDKEKFDTDIDTKGSGSPTVSSIINSYKEDDPLLFYRLIFYKNGDIQYDPDEDIVAFIKNNGVTWLNQDATDLEDSVQRAKEATRGRDRMTTAFRTRLMDITLFAPNKNIEFNDNISPDGGEDAIGRIKSSLRILKDLNSSLDEKADGGGRRVSTRYKCVYEVIEPISGIKLFEGIANMKYEGTQGQGFMARSVNMFRDSLINGRLKDIYLDNAGVHKKIMGDANDKITTFIKKEADRLGINDATVPTPFPFYTERDFRREQLYLDPGSKPIGQGDFTRGSNSHTLYAGILNGLRPNVEVCRPLNKRSRRDKQLQLALIKLQKGGTK